ncbi:hypothetical protein PQX77_006227 [Marasmius sp. AFHP31]|nr:hypothetical protein PQX77_006227 [Marasmius sp. AFHP31]
MSATPLHPQSLQPSVSNPTQRAVSEEPRSEHTSKNSGMTLITASRGVEGAIASQAREESTFVGVTAAPSDPITSMYLSSPSQDDTASTTVSNNEGYPVFTGGWRRQWISPSHWKEVLSQSKLHAELDRDAVLLLPIEEYKPDVHPSSPLGRGESLPNDGVKSDKKEKARSSVKKIQLKLQAEWESIVPSLGTLAAVDSTIFGFALVTADPVISPAARIIVIFSGICAIFGYFLVTSFIWKYCWTSGVAWGNPEDFLRSAVDVNGSYVSFALRARLPRVLMVISAFTLVVFMIVVAYSASKALLWIVLLPVLLVLWAQYPMWAFYKVAPLVAGGLDARREKLRARTRSTSVC